MKKNIKILIAFAFLLTSSIGYSEYKVRSDLFVFELPGADSWVSGDEYSIKTAWEATGEETCDPWSPEAIDQIMSFTQEQTCGVQEAREVTVREYNTSFDIYREVNTFTETQTVGVTRQRDVNFSADSWTITQDLYNCTEWQPDPNTVNFGETFTQTRDCKIDEERNAQLALNTGEVLSSFVDTRTIDAQDTQQNTGTFQDWASTESTFTEWTDINAPFDYTNWTPVIAEQTENFTQSRDYQQTQERYEQQREVDAVTGDIRDTGDPIRHEQVVTKTEDRNVVVNSTEWANVDVPYACTEWSPLANTIDEGTAFTQTRDCQQDQERTWTYALEDTTELSTRVEPQTITVTETQDSIGTKENWTTIESTYTDWTNVGGRVYTNAWNPVIAAQTTDFTQTRDYTQEQERTRDDREQNDFTNEIRITNTEVETQTISGQESRLVVVTQTAWANDGTPYACTAWSPETNTVDEGTIFTQTRDCSQDQVKTWTYTADGSVVTTRLAEQTITVQQSQSATGTFENWTAISPTYTSWTNVGGRNYTNTWNPAISSQTTNFTQTRDYTQEQERERTDREQNDFTNEIRSTGTTTETQTITGQESRSITVSSTNWYNVGSPYACTTWSPATNTVDEGTNFTQTRDCSQDQEKVWNYDSGLTSVGSRTETQTITIQQSQAATGTMENWVTIAPTYSTWTDTGSGYNYGAWTPSASTQTTNFTQSRSYSQDQERTRTEREQNSYTGVIRNTGTFTETQTINKSQSRTVSVSAGSYSNTGSTYACSAWSPAASTVDEGTSFTQTRDCSQDQVRTWTYTASGSTIHTRTQTQTITVQESQTATGTMENWVVVSPIYSNWSNVGSRYNYSTWSPAINDQNSSFTQTRSYSQDQERTRTEREQNSYTGVIRNTGTFTESQTITGTESRTVTVNASSWSNSGSVYSCTNWSPEINGQTSDFTQTRNCQQDQVKSFSYIIDGATVATDTDNQTITVTQSRVVDVASSSGGGTDGWSSWSTYDQDNNCTTWSPATSTVNQGQTFTQSRTCYDYQERFKYYVIDGQVVNTDRETRTVTDNQSRSAVGTKPTKVCRYDSNNYIVRYTIQYPTFRVVDRYLWNGAVIADGVTSNTSYSSGGYLYTPSTQVGNARFAICREPN